MEWIEKNYLIIILIGLFLVFALIGYLIDNARKINDKKEEEAPIPTKVNEIEIKKIKTEPEVKTDNSDELLNNYYNEKQ